MWTLPRLRLPGCWEGRDSLVWLIHTGKALSLGSFADLPAAELWAEITFLPSSAAASSPHPCGCPRPSRPQTQFLHRQARIWLNRAAGFELWETGAGVHSGGWVDWGRGSWSASAYCSCHQEWLIWCHQTFQSFSRGVILFCLKCDICKLFVTNSKT